MKKLICIILALGLMLGLCAAAEENDVMFCWAEEQPAGNRLGFEVVRALSDGTENQVFSPVSLAFALAMASEGAQGETKEQMLVALEAEDVSEVAALQAEVFDAGMRLANAAFVKGSLTLEEAYVEALNDRFGARWFEGETIDIEQVNRWTEDATDGLIEKLLTEKPSSETQMLLMNAIAMDAKWFNEFNPEATAEDVFHAPDGDVIAEFMREQARYIYGERDGVQLLKLPYLGEEYEPGRLAMYVALPEAGGVSAVLDALCDEGMNYFVFDEATVLVNLSMPKVDISAENELTEALRVVGVRKMFSDEADFSAMCADTPLKVGGVLQKARMMIDEEGTKAAAVTVIEMVETSARLEEPVEFKMDRPFVTVIADEVSGAVCFIGVVANPAAN